MIAYDDYDDEVATEWMTCDYCGGSGEIVTCIDDMCRGSGECMHGDGMRACRACDGEGFVRVEPEMPR